MAETFDGFGIERALENQPRAVAQGDFEFLLKRIPIDVLRAFSQMAEGRGVSAIMKKMAEAEALRRKRLGKGLRAGNVGRRLGPRSGAIDTLIANKVTAPSFERLSELEGGLLQRGQEFGLSGLQEMLEFMQNQVGLQEGLEQARRGPGFLDYAGPVIDIASIAAAPATGGTSLAIPAARQAASGGGGGNFGGFNLGSPAIDPTRRYG